MTILPLIIQGVMNFSISLLRVESESRYLLLKPDTFSCDLSICFLLMEMTSVPLGAEERLLLVGYTEFVWFGFYTFI